MIPKLESPPIDQFEIKNSKMPASPVTGSFEAPEKERRGANLRKQDELAQREQRRRLKESTIAQLKAEQVAHAARLADQRKAEELRVAEIEAQMNALAAEVAEDERHAEEERLAIEAEEQRLAVELERQRLAEVEKQRLAEDQRRERQRMLEEEAREKKLADEAERRRIAKDQRIADEAKKQRLAVQAEKKRLAAENIKNEERRMIEIEARNMRLAEEQKQVVEAKNKKLAAQTESQRIANKQAEMDKQQEAAQEEMIAKDRKKLAAEGKRKAQKGQHDFEANGRAKYPASAKKAAQEKVNASTNKRLQLGKMKQVPMQGYPGKPLVNEQNQRKRPSSSITFDAEDLPAQKTSKTARGSALVAVILQQNRKTNCMFRRSPWRLLAKRRTCALARSLLFQSPHGVEKD
jgi:hypothetical protein